MAVYFYGGENHMSGKNIKVALQITADLNQARAAIRNLNQDLSRMSGGMQSLQISQGRMSDSLDTTNNNMQRLSTSVNQQNLAVRQLMATTAAYFSVTKLMDAADGYTSLHNRLKLVTEVQNNATQSQINLKNAMNDTFSIAQGAAADWGGVSSIYEKIYKNSERLNLSQTQVGSITETVTKSISNSGASAQAASAALYQLGQSFDKGSLNGDEFVSVSENAGYVMDVLAKGLGVTRAELRQMSSDGQLTTEAMVKAFTNMHDKVNQAFGATQTTIGGGFTLVENALKKYVGETDQSVGATRFLVTALSGLANNLESIVNIMGLAAWGLFTQKMIAQATAIKTNIIDSNARRAAMLAELQASAQAANAEVVRTQAVMQLTRWQLEDAKATMIRMTGLQRLSYMQQVVLPLERQLTQATAAHAAAQTTQTATSNALATATSRLAVAGRAALAMFGGPLGLLVTGLSVGAMYLMMRDNADAGIDVFNDQTKTVAELVEEYIKLDNIQKRIATRQASEKLDDLSKRYKDQREQLLGLVDAITRNSSASDKDRQKASQLFEQYRAGQITATQLANQIQNLTSVNDTAKSSIDRVATSTNKAKSELDRQNQIIEGYSGKTNSAVAATDIWAGSVNNLTKAYKELAKSIQDNTFSNLFQIDQMKDGVDPKLAAKRAKALEDLNADPKSTQTYFRLPDELDVQITNDFKVEKERAALEEKITKEKQNQKEQQEKIKVLMARSNEQTRNMLKVYQAFTKTGQLSDSQARYFTSEVGRESSFLDKNLFGSHVDKNNQYTNTGIISWQKDRSKSLMSYLKAKGVIDEKGNIKQTQEALDAQAEFLVNELFSQKGYGSSKQALLKNAGYSDLQQIIGKNFIKWDIDGKQIGTDLAAKNQKRQNGYFAQLNQILGNNPANAQAEIGKISQFDDTIEKYLEDRGKNQISLRESLYTEEEKLIAEHNKKVKEITEAGFSKEETKSLLAKENKRYEEALTKRTEIYKRVQDALPQLEQSLLKANGKDLESDLDAVEEKYKQLKADFASLLLTETDPAKASQYQQLLFKIDFVIDKEQITLQFNDAMKQLNDLQSLRQQKQDNLKLQYDSGQISQPQYSQGLKAIDIEMKPQLQGLIELAKQLAVSLGDAFSVEKLNAMNIELNKTDTSFRKFLPTIEQIQESIAGGMTTAILDWADGTKSAGDAFRQFASDFLREIAQMILKQMIFNAVKAASSYMGYSDGGLVTGYSTGGYTGVGGKYEPAGIVHKDEFVIRKESTSQSGAKEFLTYFNRYGMQALNQFKNNGYADGGLVGMPNISIPDIQAPKLNDPVAQIGQASSFSANQQFLLVDDPSRLSDYIKSGEGQETLVVMMSRDPAKFKAALKIGG